MRDTEVSGAQAFAFRGCFVFRIVIVFSTLVEFAGLKIDVKFLKKLCITCVTLSWNRQ